MLRPLLISVICFFSIFAIAQSSEVCELPIGSGNSRALLTMETNQQHAVVLSISSGNSGPDAQTTFRAAGLDINGWKFDGNPLTDYFSVSPASPANQKQVTFTPLYADSIPSMLGRKLTFNAYSENVYAEWKTSADANAYSQAVRLSYTYGRTCQQLATTAITAIDAAGIPTFAPVQNATAYVVRVYLGSILKLQTTLQPGQPIGFTPIQSGTYAVTITATASGFRSSAESAAYDWQLTAAPVALGASEYCQETFASGNSQAYLTWQTLADGDVEIKISGNGAAFRGNGMSNSALANFTVGQGPASDYFSRVMTSGSNTYKLHLKNPSVRPALGEKIHCNGTVEWVTSSNSNAYGTYSFEYTYGTVCGSLTAPEITSIHADSTIHFTSQGAGITYTARVYLGNVFKYSQVVQPGDVLHFTPYEDGIYSVTLSASGAGYFASDESAPYAWTLTAPTIEIGPSEYCHQAIGSGYSRAWFTWQTLANGDVEISISGDAATSFRANGFAFSGFTVGNMSASSYFVRQYDGDGATTYTLHLRDSLARPSDGQTISFRGTVEWRTANNNNAYNNNLTFSYTYGSVCPQLMTPVIDEIDEDNVLRMSNIDPEADHFRIYVYRGELLVYSADVNNDQELEFEPTVSGTYTVYVEACPSGSGVVTSDLSEPYYWVLRGSEQDLGLSEVCHKYVAGDDGGVYLTAETDVDGQIIFKLTGPNNPVWRAAGIDLNAMTIGGSPVANFFKTYGAFVGDSLFVLRPTSAGLGVFFPGDKINFNGTLEWSVKSTTGATISRWVTTFRFDYTYGTSCTALLPRLQTPQGLSVSEPGVVTFASVEHAGTYEIKVLDEESDEMVLQAVENGELIDRKMAIYNPFAYYVSIRAIPTDETLYRPSLWSDAVDWLPDYQPVPQPPVVDDDPEYSRIEDIPVNMSGKFVIDGHLYIVRDGRVYTILGTLVK